MQMRSSIGQVHAVADEERIVDEVMVGEHNPFRKTGRAGSVLDVDGIFESDLCLSGSQGFVGDALSQPVQILKDQPIVLLSLTKKHEPSQMRQISCSQATLPALSDFGTDLLKHRRVVRVLEVRLKQKRMCAGLLQRIGQFPSPVGGIDIDENGPDCRRRELKQNPLFAVESPDPYSISLADTQGQQPFRSLADSAVKLRIGQPDVLVTHYQRFIAREPGQPIPTGLRRSYDPEAQDRPNRRNNSKEQDSRGFSFQISRQRPSRGPWNGFKVNYSHRL